MRSGSQRNAVSASCVVCCVLHAQIQHKIVLYPGIAVEELTALMQSLFELEVAPIALEGEVITIHLRDAHCFSSKLLYFS